MGFLHIEVGKMALFVKKIPVFENFSKKSGFFISINFQVFPTI
jgi:hypothetical protein